MIWILLGPQNQSASKRVFYYWPGTLYAAARNTLWRAFHSCGPTLASELSNLQVEGKDILAEGLGGSVCPMPDTSREERYTDGNKETPPPYIYIYTYIYMYIYIYISPCRSI